MDASELYDPEFRELIKSKKPTVIIPVGSIEQHGAHLPITTDSDIVTEIASRLAKKCGFIVFPTISYGISHEHDPFFSLSGDLGDLHNIVKEFWEKHNIKSVLVLNGHNGNKEQINTVQMRYDKNHYHNMRGAMKVPEDVKVRAYSYWHFMKHEFDHAGFVETSIMLAISDKVKMKKAKKGFTTKGLSKEEMDKVKRSLNRAMPGGFVNVAKNGVWGDPTGATKKDGEKFLTEIVRNLAKKCQS